MNLQTLRDMDYRITLKVQHWRRPWTTEFLKILTITGAGKFWWASGIVFFLLHFVGLRLFPRQELFLAAYFAPFVSWPVGSLLKKHFDRTRPGLHMGCNPIIKAPSCASFPSAHSASTFSFFTALLLLRHPWAWAFGIWAPVIAYSRIYLGVHYFTDVFVGAVLGILCGALVGSLAFWFNLLN